MNFENAIAKMPPEHKNELLEMDMFIKSLRPVKFKRAVDKNGTKITYTSADFGISYAIMLPNDKLSHNFGWYYIYNKQNKTWGRKPDYLEETLAEIEKNEPKIAERLLMGLKNVLLAETLFHVAASLIHIMGKRGFLVMAELFCVFVKMI